MMKRLETTSLPCMNDEILQATPIIPGRHFPNLHQQMGKGGDYNDYTHVYTTLSQLNRAWKPLNHTETNKTTTPSMSDEKQKHNRGIK